MTGAMGRTVPEKEYQVGIIYNLTVSAQGRTASVTGIVRAELGKQKSVRQCIFPGRGIHSDGSAGNNLGGIRRQITPQIFHMQSS